MTPLTTPDLILFTIHSVLKASAAIKKGIADGLRQKELVLPLPDYDPMVRETTIEFYFRNEGKSYVEQIPDLKKINQKAQRDVLSPSQLNRYRAYYHAFWNKELDSSTVLSYFSIKNLDQEKEAPTLLSLIAGNLVSTGIEFYQFFPEKIHPKNFKSKALNGFMQGLDQIPFSKGHFNQKNFAEHFFPNLFIGISEWLTHSELSSKWHPHTFNFVQAVTEGIGQEIMNKPTEGRAAWAQLIFHAFLSTSATYLHSNTQQKLVKELSGLTLALLEEERIMSQSGVDLIIRSALSYSGQVLDEKDTVSSHLQSWLAQLLKKLADNPILHPAILPDVVAATLETGGQTLAEKWKENNRLTSDLLADILKSSGHLIKHIPTEGWPEKEDFLKILQKSLLMALSKADTLSYKELSKEILNFQQKTHAPTAHLLLLWSISIDAMQHHHMYYKEALPIFVYQTLLDNWQSIEALILTMPPEKSKEFVRIIVQHYYNNLYSNLPISKDHCQQTMESIIKQINPEKRPFLNINAQDLINQLATL